MASDKRRRKAAKLSKPKPTTPFRHRDGDRRRRGGPTADQAIKFKRAMQEGLIPPPEEP